MPDFEFKQNTNVQTKPQKAAPAARMPALTSVTQPPKKKIAQPAELTEEQKAQQVLAAATQAAQAKQAAQEEVLEKEDIKADEDKPKYDPDELARIFDEIIFAGEYSEEVMIRGRLRVVFRTRTSDEIDQISRVIDGTQANLIATLSEKRAVLNLQYALAWYQSENLAGAKIEERAAFLRKLPGPIVGALLNALGEFDNKVFEACKEAEANF
jgi:hypothetical protein